MPKQVSPIIKLKGTIDDLTFYKSQDGFLARMKGGVSADRLKNDPKFDQTRRAMSEFGIGGKAGRLFRTAWNHELGKASDNRVASRITQLMVSVLKTDLVSDFGSRRVENGDLTKLKGFEFNNTVRFSATVKAPFSATVNRTTGQVTVNIVEHVPKTEIAAPENATHYKVFAVAGALDFATDEMIVVRQSSANLLWDITPITASTIPLALPPNSTLPIFVLLGVEFVNLINGKDYPLSKGLSTLQVLEVDMV